MAGWPKSLHQQEQTTVCVCVCVGGWVGVRAHVREYACVGYACAEVQQLMTVPGKSNNWDSL